MENIEYTIKGIPNDLLTNEKVNDRRLKVSNADDLNTNSITAKLLNEVVSTNRQILAQLKLLNARTEEAFNTKIEDIDIE